MFDDTISVILAGGVGARLYPLTAHRAKPAVPFAGRYRIIDFTLSNCLHSGIRRVLVLTQYKSHSLQKHLRDGWSMFNPEIGEFITPVPPQMRTGESWYARTADAIYQNQYLIERSGASSVVILSGDHIYRMDYAAMMRFHRQSEAELTARSSNRASCLKVPGSVRIAGFTAVYSTKTSRSRPASRLESMTAIERDLPCRRRVFAWCQGTTTSRQRQCSASVRTPDPLPEFWCWILCSIPVTDPFLIKRAGRK